MLRGSCGEVAAIDAAAIEMPATGGVLADTYTLKPKS